MRACHKAEMRWTVNARMVPMHFLATMSGDAAEPVDLSLGGVSVDLCTVGDASTCQLSPQSLVSTALWRLSNHLKFLDLAAFPHVP